MKKDEAKEIISAVYHEVLHKIDTTEKLNADYLMDFVHNAAKKISLYANKTEQQKQFKNPLLQVDSDYHELAKASIHSYSQYNSNIQEISLTQNDIVTKFNTEENNLIELFKDLQAHLNTEIDIANKTISDLIVKIKTLEEKSSIDSLTKVFNRHALNDYLTQIINSSYGHHNDTFMIMIDIDDFKILNDSHGHLAGDKVLVFLAMLLKRTIRDNDRIFRYGGEEFILILTRIKSEQAASVAERIMELIHKNKLLYKNTELKMTVSIGLSQMKEDDTIETFIERTDMLLYEAKKTGKDQIKADF